MSETQLITNQNTLQVQWQGLEPIAPIGQIDCTNGTEVVQENRAESVSLEQKKKIGRPVSITEAYKYILARDGALKYAEVIANDALTAPRASDRREAIEAITDRLEGKPMQNVRMSGIFLVAAPGAEALAALDSWADE